MSNVQVHTSDLSLPNLNTDVQRLRSTTTEYDGKNHCKHACQSTPPHTSSAEGWNTKENARLTRKGKGQRKRKAAKEHAKVCDAAKQFITNRFNTPCRTSKGRHTYAKLARHWPPVAGTVRLFRPPQCSHRQRQANYTEATPRTHTARSQTTQSMESRDCC